MFAPHGLAALPAVARGILRARQATSPDENAMFAFFSSRLGCIGSIIASIVGSLLLLVILRGCGAGF
jgi:hypothetical protein